MSIITNYVFVFMLQIFSTQLQATIVLGRFLVTLLLASSLPLPQLVIQDLVLTVILLILFYFFSLLPTKEEGSSTTSPSSAVIENLYQADPCAIVPFQAGQHQYELNFKGSHFKGSHLQLCSALYSLAKSPRF